MLFWRKKLAPIVFLFNIHKLQDSHHVLSYIQVTFLRDVITTSNPTAHLISGSSHPVLKFSLTLCSIFLIEEHALIDFSPRVLPCRATGLDANIVQLKNRRAKKSVM